MMASKSAALLSLFLCVLLPVVTRAQDEDDQWFWIMANSVNSSAACPGRCLAVNDTGAADYKDKPVVLVACKGDDSSEPSSASNSNQRWLRASNSEPNTTIQFNASAATEGQSIDILCLQPDPATSNKTLKIATCTGQPSQKWIVANNSIASLAFDRPHYLAMSERLGGFLNASDGPLGWRQATILPSSRSPNASFTTTFSMVEGTQDLVPPLSPRANESNQSRNFITNGDFEQSSYDFPNSTATLTVNTADPFSLCNWLVMKGSATLTPNTTAPENKQSLLLKDTVVRQSIATSPGAYYVLVLKVAIARPDPSSTDESTQCTNNDTLSVNPYPSSNVHLDVEVSSPTWTTQHVSFQAVGNLLQLAFQGCATCGCYLDGLNLMQVIDSSPFPPPPPRPSPPTDTVPDHPEPEDRQPLPGGLPGLAGHSNRLSNGAVVGIVAGTAALFLVIGGACFWVVVANKKEMGKENEVGMGRPREWSIQTTTPAQSQPGARGNSSTTVPIPLSASAAASASSSRTTTTSAPLSSSNPHSERGA